MAASPFAPGTKNYSSCHELRFERHIIMEAEKGKGKASTVHGAFFQSPMTHCSSISFKRKSFVIGMPINFCRTDEIEICLL